MKENDFFLKLFSFSQYMELCIPMGDIPARRRSRELAALEGYRIHRGGGGRPVGDLGKARSGEQQLRRQCTGLSDWSLGSLFRAHKSDDHPKLRRLLPLL